MLFECLAGSLPFGSGRSNQADLIAAILRDAPVDPRNVTDPGAVSDELAEVLLRAVAKDRGARFGSAMAMAHAIEAAQREGSDEAFDCLACASCAYPKYSFSFSLGGGGGSATLEKPTILPAAGVAVALKSRARSVALASSGRVRASSIGSSPRRQAWPAADSQMASSTMFSLLAPTQQDQQLYLFTGRLHHVFARAVTLSRP